VPETDQALTRRLPRSMKFGPLGSANSPDRLTPHQGAKMAKEPELHFYPGDKRLIFFVGGSSAMEAEAWGGPVEELPAGAGEKFGAGPTDAGSFVISGPVRYRTDTWTWSKIPWGARLKYHPHDFEDLLYEVGGRWRSVRQETGLRRANIARRYNELYGAGYRIPDRWLFNDFGPMAIRYFRDTNHNRRLDGNERLEGEMFHTTAESEAEDAVFRTQHPDAKTDPPITMFESHGCIHLKTYERDNLLARGAFKSGMTLIIHKYDEHFRP
jgi:hypothetical protein